MDVFTPKVSIIIPVYNGSNYLREAIDSALAQTYDNFEVIVVNDGSTDQGETEKIALSYGDQIRYFSKPNGGVATALNFGIEKMSGEYFSWLSHDDVYYENKLAVQIDYLRKLADKTTVLYGGWDIIDQYSQQTGVMNLAAKAGSDKLNCGLYPVLNGMVNGCTLLIHKTCFETVGLFDPALRTTQDYDLWLQLFKRYPIFFHPENLLKSRSHAEQGSLADTHHQEEATRLWIRFVEECTQADIAESYHTLPAYYYAMAARLKFSYVPAAYERAVAKLRTFEYPVKVSVVLPTYNREWCIQRAIDSVLRQTYKNYELIVVDDGSTDQTRECLKAYGAKIRYVHQQQSGASAARNLGIKTAVGEYIAFIDSDDEWSQDHLEQHVQELDNHVEWALTYNFAHVVDADHQPVAEYAADLGNDYYPALIYIDPTPITTPSVVIRKAVIEEIGGFDEALDMCEDLDLWRRVARQHSIHCIPQFLTTVYTRPNHFEPDLYFKKRKGFLEKALQEDPFLPSQVVSELYLELYRHYYGAGCCKELILADFLQQAGKVSALRSLLKPHLIALLTNDYGAFQYPAAPPVVYEEPSCREKIVRVLKKWPWLYKGLRFLYRSLRREG